MLADISEATCTPLCADVVEGYKWRIEIIYRELLAKELVREFNDREKDISHLIGEAYTEISQAVDHYVRLDHRPAEYQPPTTSNGAVGRPRFEISHDQVQYLLECRFSLPQIAKLVGVSISTIRRRMSSHGLSVRATYSTMSNSELDNVIADTQKRFPMWGNRQMYGHLISIGIRVQIHRVCDSQRRVDPQGSLMRRLRHLRRRVYSVPGPQHLWHIDGHHKLIR